MDLLKEYVETKTKENEMNNKQKSLEKAISLNIEANKEHRSIFEKYYDSILLYSASVFSFTLGVVGFINENKIEAIKKVGLILPNIFWLYGCWFMFLLACLLIITRKRFDALYVQAFGMEHYTNSYLEKEKAEYEFENLIRGK